MLRKLRAAGSGGPARLKLDQQEVSADATSLSASIGQANRLCRKIFAWMIQNSMIIVTRAGPSYNHCPVDIVLQYCLSSHDSLNWRAASDTFACLVSELVAFYHAQMLSETCSRMPVLNTNFVLSLPVLRASLWRAFPKE